MKQLARDEAALIGRIDPAPMLENTLRWCAINSGTANPAGLERQAGELADAFSGLPGEVTLEDPAPVSGIAPDGGEIALRHGRHLVLRVRPEADRRILLTGHMDTVYPADHPFSGAVWLDEDRLNAPGAADMKGGIAIMLAALTAFEAGTGARRIGYDVLINSDEETGSLSSAGLIAALARGKYATLTYEPSTTPEGAFAGERGGSGNYSLIVRGRAAHAGRNPEEGRNAIVAAARLAVALKTLEHDDLGVNPARIDGGGANNVVPALAVLRVNVRPRTGKAAQWFEDDLRLLVQQISAELGVAVSLHGGITRPPKSIDPAAQELFDLARLCCAQLKQDFTTIPSGGVCDGNNIAACGIAVIDTMGARGGAIHSPQEYLIVPSLGERAALSALMLHRLAMGDAL